MVFDTPYQRQTYIPLPFNSGSRHQDHEVVLSLVPIHIVTHASQLPKEFLFPSSNSHLIVGFDCEGVNLCRNGTLCIIQLAFSDAVYIVDAIEGGEKLIKACKRGLQSRFITKVVHDCKRDSEALYFQFGIKLHNVMDTQIAYSLIEEQQGRRRSSDDPISFVGLLADPQYCGISYNEKKDMRALLKEDPKFWAQRPFSEMMLRAAVDDVRFLPYVHHKIMEKLNDRLLFQVAVRSALHCRSFCVSDKGFADWRPIPTIPESFKVKGNAPEEEILSVINVPSGKMGHVIGKKGASILSIKESCKDEILIGGERGPLDKVIIIGPIKELRKAEAMIRGRMS